MSKNYSKKRVNKNKRNLKKSLKKSRNSINRKKSRGGSRNKVLRKRTLKNKVLRKKTSKKKLKGGSMGDNNSLKEQSVPEQSVPEQSVPEQSVPEQHEQEQAKPGFLSNMFNNIKNNLFKNSKNSKSNSQDMVQNFGDILDVDSNSDKFGEDSDMQKATQIVKDFAKKNNNRINTELKINYDEA